jgi:hypothetical protein
MAVSSVDLLIPQNIEQLNQFIGMPMNVTNQIEHHSPHDPQKL